jgi:hypothetical protein
MKIAMNSVILALLLGFVTTAIVTAQTDDPPATADDIVQRMLQRDALRKAQISGYTATRHYIAVNKQRRAEMLVGIACTSNGEKKFTVLSEEGSSAIRKHVFYKMLQEEIEASRRDTSGSTRITPDNYEFHLLGKKVIEERPHTYCV